MPKLNANCITQYNSPVEPEKVWTLEHLQGFGSGNNAFRVRHYIGNCLITELGYTSEVTAREVFEKKVEAYVNSYGGVCQ